MRGGSACKCLPKRGSGALGALADWRTSYWGDDAGGTCLQVTGPCLLVCSLWNPGSSSVKQGCGRSAEEGWPVIAAEQPLAEPRAGLDHVTLQNQQSDPTSSRDHRICDTSPAVGLPIMKSAICSNTEVLGARCIDMGINGIIFLLQRCEDYIQSHPPLA